jgi:hypothetical protein
MLPILQEEYLSSDTNLFGDGSCRTTPKSPVWSVMLEMTDSMSRGGNRFFYLRHQCGEASVHFRGRRELNGDLGRAVRRSATVKRTARAAAPTKTPTAPTSHRTSSPPTHAASSLTSLSLRPRGSSPTTAPRRGARLPHGGGAIPAHR